MLTWSYLIKIFVTYGASSFSHKLELQITDYLAQRAASKQTAKLKYPNIPSQTNFCISVVHDVWLLCSWISSFAEKWLVGNWTNPQNICFSFLFLWFETSEGNFAIKRKSFNFKLFGFNLQDMASRGRVRVADSSPAHSSRLLFVLLLRKH